MLFTHTHRVCLLLLTAGAAFAQNAPEFEVASIKKADPLDTNAVMSGQMHMGMTIDAARVDIRSLSLTELLRIAYKVKTFQVSGPEWLNTERFDITAKMPAGASRDQAPAMLQALLADRFKITLHRSTTEQPVYALVVAKGGAKLKESPPDTDLSPADPAAPAPADGSAQVRAMATSNAKGVVTSSGPNGAAKLTTGADGMHIELIKMNTTGMLDLLGRFVDRPIVDMTELMGKYDLTLDVGMEDVLNLARASGINVPMRQSADPGRASEPGSSSIFAAIQQYGLKLEPRKAPLELLVIDHAERTPTEN